MEFASIQKADMSYWFPIIQKAGLPVPHTAMCEMDDDAIMFVSEAISGEPTSQGDLFEPFIARLATVAASFREPFFLRTGHTSGKHRWNHACCVRNRALLRYHVMTLVEESELSGIGLPYKTWFVRQMLPTVHVGTCSAYDGMPVVKEFRVFVSNGEVKCWHPYWPRKALEKGGLFLSDAQFKSLCDPGDDIHEILNLASRAGFAVGGSWSVDIFQSNHGWYVTDMAPAEVSFHWEGCKNG